MYDVIKVSLLMFSLVVYMDKAQNYKEKIACQVLIEKCIHYERQGVRT